ncbi:MAG: hypothetical protein DMG00_30935, partial [Acidobacteria bacterium]
MFLSIVPPRPRSPTTVGHVHALVPKPAPWNDSAESRPSMVATRRVATGGRQPRQLVVVESMLEVTSPLAVMVMRSIWIMSQLSIDPGPLIRILIRI